MDQSRPYEDPPEYMTPEQEGLDFGTDRAADAASTQLAETSACAGGCGKSWTEAGGGWRGFMALSGDKTCMSPVWHCDPCVQAKDEAEWQAAQTKLPEHVRVMRDRHRALYHERYGHRRASLNLSDELKAELDALQVRLLAEYEVLGFNPDHFPAAGTEEPQWT